MAEIEIDVELKLDRFVLDVEIATDARVLGVFGPSGSGKSSLLEAVAGIRRDARGRIRFRGESWLDTDAGVRLLPEARRVGFVPQDALLFPHLDVRRNLMSGTHRAKQNGASAQSLDEIAQKLGIFELLARDTATLSGGERQRVALGRALLSSPRLLLLDEPFGSLDLPLRRSLRPLLRSVCDDAKIPVILVSHDPEEIEELATEVLRLEAGRVTQS